jgi:hypothetical protein
MIYLLKDRIRRQSIALCSLSSWKIAPVLYMSIVLIISMIMSRIECNFTITLYLTTKRQIKYATKSVAGYHIPTH